MICKCFFSDLINVPFNSQFYDLTNKLTLYITFNSQFSDLINKLTLLTNLF